MSDNPTARDLELAAKALEFAAMPEPEKNIALLFALARHEGGRDAMFETLLLSRNAGAVQ